MKRNDMLLLGAAGVAAYFLFFNKKTQAAADMGGGGGFDLGALFNDAINSIFGGMGALLGQQASTLQQQSKENQYAPRTPEANLLRWTAPALTPQSTLAGITSFGAYNPAAIQAAPTAGLTNMGAAVSQISDFAKSMGGSVGTAYSAGGAIPVAVVPVSKGSAVSGLYTTAEVYIAQATGKAPSSATAAATPAAAALSPAQRMARGLW